MIPGLKIIPIFLVLAATAAYAADNNKDALKAGAILYRDKGCGFCHGPAGEGTKKAPALADIQTDSAWPPEKITDQILNGGKKMPPFRDALSDEEIQQLVAWLLAKDRPAPPPAESPSANH